MSVWEMRRMRSEGILRSGDIMPRRCILLADSMASAARLSLCKESTVTSLRAKSTTNKVWVLLFTSFNVLRIAKMPCKSTLLYAKLHRGGVS